MMIPVNHRWLKRGLTIVDDQESGYSPDKKRKSQDDYYLNGKQGPGLFSWSSGLPWKKEQPLMRVTSSDHDHVKETSPADFDKLFFQQSDDDGWVMREVVSRDGQASLKAKVLFASFDQMSELAGGDGACSAIAIAVADWLNSNRDSIPQLRQFDGLILDGSWEWRKLCYNEAYKDSFENNHFDLETVLDADIRPLTVLPGKSFTGVFSPEKFENLAGFMSFDDIWSQISKTGGDDDQRVYIVSWNDHFFVLKVDSDACYIIDSFGERLFAGCKQGYILKFDDSSLMMAVEQGDAEMIYKGKDCCGEFIKRFLAAITLKRLKKQEKKKIVPMLTLLKRLQIDVHYCSKSSSSDRSFYDHSNSCRNF